MIVEGNEEDEIDEDEIEKKMMEDLLLSQFRSISGLDASYTIREYLTQSQSNALQNSLKMKDSTKDEANAYLKPH